MPGKPIVFVSHLSAEEDVALKLKELLQAFFGDELEVFVSSDDESIHAGEQWLHSVSRHLKKCVAEILLLSPSALDRHWIHFEAGAGWIRGVPVMPVCFGGITPRKLPEPLRQLQAIDASDARSVAKLIRGISVATRIKTRRSNCDKFVRFVQGINRQWAKGPVFPKMYEVSADIQSDLPDFLRGAKEEILLCGIHFNISLANRLADYVNALAAGVGLTICAVRPDSETVRVLAQFAGDDPDTLRSECQLTIPFFDRLKQLHASRRSNSPRVGRLILKLTDHAPNARAYLFDEECAEGLLLYTPYLRLRDSTQCPTFLFRKNHAVFGSFAESCRHHSSASDTYYDSTSETEA